MREWSRPDTGEGVLGPLISLAVDFAKRELAEGREAHDSFPFGPFWSDVMERAFDVGFFGISIPEEHGGSGLGPGALAYVLEELGRTDASLAAMIFTHAAAHEIIRAASEHADCREIYRAVAAHPKKPLAFQPYATLGEAIGPTAEVISGKALLSGSATYLVLGGMAEFAVVPARDSEGDNFSYYLLSLKGAGVELLKPVVSLGLHACPAVDAVLHRAEGVLLGSRGKGPYYFRRMCPRMALPAAAMSLGIMKGSFSEALSYAKDRHQGGRQIIDWPEVRMILSGMAAQIETGHAALDRAARLLESASAGWESAAAAAALEIGEASVSVTTDGVQILGGNGYMKDYGQEKRMRDAVQARALLGMTGVRRLELIAGVIEAM
jgi:alkylation response protein AidB-like acyl-CoA dehydrogenase